jgi:anti-sigma regulatory factor (Ser/Thr protein kinase)
MPASVQVDIPRNLVAPARARRAVEAVGMDLDPQLMADGKLLVSELVTNSVKYGGDGQIHLAMRSDGRRHLHVDVVDEGPGFEPAARDRPAAEVGGWGLHLVRTLSDRWGIRAGTTHVWFEIHRSSGGAAAA